MVHTLAKSSTCHYPVEFVYRLVGPPSTAMTVRWKKKYNRRQQHGTHDTRQALEQKIHTTGCKARHDTRQRCGPNDT